MFAAGEGQVTPNGPSQRNLIHSLQLLQSPTAADNQRRAVPAWVPSDSGQGLGLGPWKRTEMTSIHGNSKTAKRIKLINLTHSLIKIFPFCSKTNIKYHPLSILRTKKIVTLEFFCSFPQLKKFNMQIFVANNPTLKFFTIGLNCEKNSTP